MYQKQYSTWLTLTRNEADLHEELLSVADDEKAIEDRFYQSLAFGTGGLRGVIGAGTNRMNIFTVLRAAAGVAKYYKSVCENPSIAISYDTRNKSREFAFASACLYAKEGIKVYLYDRPLPTPVLSYTVRALGCTGGIMVTASHNPAEYNGYKVYEHSGCQIGNEEAKAIEAAIEATPYSELDFDRAQYADRILPVPAEVYEGFLQAAQKQSLSDGDISLKIVYTPLNGTGNEPVREILKRIGCKNVSVVSEQENPDITFATCPYPNPEMRPALSLAIRDMEEQGADLILATDPDSDRVGVAARNKGEIRLLTGNETGILLTNYLLERKKALGTLPKEPLVITTIVSTTMCEPIAAAYGGSCKYVYTGFKFIGAVMDDYAAKGKVEDILIGFEESYGYLIGDHARDKDAVTACMIIAEMADYYAAQGLTLPDVLERLYQQYGYYRSTLKSYAFKGKEGSDRMKAIMQALRTNPPKELAGEACRWTDYMHVEGMEPMNVLECNATSFKALLRPSGTEPKMKLYVHTKGNERQSCERITEEVLADFDRLIETV